jgi:2-dehydropantoate 2-reductase
MRVLVVGAGGIGGFIGGYLAKGGAEVSFLGRRKTWKDAIEKNGLELVGEDGSTVVRPKAVLVDLPAGYQTDLVMVAVKREPTENVLTKLRGIEFDSVVSLQNGLDKYELLGAALGSKKTLGLFSLCFGTVIEDGKINAAKIGKTYIGEVDGGISRRAREIARLFERGGLPVELSDDILSLEWSKKAHWIPMSLISAVARCYFPEVYGRQLSALYLKCMAEIASVASAEGITLRDLEGFEPKRLLGLGESAPQVLAVKGGELAAGPLKTYKQIMLQDVEAGRKTEMEETAGYVLRKAEKHGIRLPYTETLVRLIRFWEARR